MLILARVMPAAFEVLDDLFNRLRTEVRDCGKLGFGLGQQLADRLDTGPLEAVVGTDAELELVDQDVVGPPVATAPLSTRRFLPGNDRPRAVSSSTRSGSLEDREALDQDLGSLAERRVRFDRTVGLPARG